MLVVDARDIGLGRLLAVEPDVLDRALIGPKVILFYFALAGDSGLLTGWASKCWIVYGSGWVWCVGPALLGTGVRKGR